MYSAYASDKMMGSYGRRYRKEVKVGELWRNYDWLFRGNIHYIKPSDNIYRLEITDVGDIKKDKNTFYNLSEY